MPRNELLEVRVGISAWLKASHAILTLLGALAALASPAGWTWKLASILVLLTTSVFLYGRSIRTHRPGILRLHADGSGLIIRSAERAVDANLREHGWVSRFFCMVPMRETASGRKRFYLVCRSDNRPDEYRRLLALLRMRPSTADNHGMILS